MRTVARDNRINPKAGLPTNTKGIFQATRDGDTEAVDRLLADKPELLVAANPYDWTKSINGYEVCSRNFKPIEIASLFNHPAVVAKLLEISRDSPAIGKPWDDHLPFDGHFDALRIAIALEHEDVVKAIEADIWARLYLNPELLNRASSDGRTLLAYAAEQGHHNLVLELRERGATGNATECKTIVDFMAAKNASGSPAIPGSAGHVSPDVAQVTRTDFEIDLPESTELPRMSPLNNAHIRLGIATINGEFQPKGMSGDMRSEFVEFPEPFPNEQFSNVRLILTNRNDPQIVGSATTCLLDGQQGFLLRARNSLAEASTSKSVSFSWMAVLPTDRPQDTRFDVRYGLIPHQRFPAAATHACPHTGQLYADAPMHSTSEKFVFLTATESGIAINAAAADADDCGILIVTACNANHTPGEGRISWMVIAERASGLGFEPKEGAAVPSDATPNVQSTASEYFGTDDLWLYAARAQPKNFTPEGMLGDWRSHGMRLPSAFVERRPSVFVTANIHGTNGYDCAVVALSSKCQTDGFSISARSFDPQRGRSNFDCIAIGHCRDLPTEGHRDDALSAWQRFIEVEDGCHHTAYELAVSGEIDVNEFGHRGGSLLMHAVYERHERASLALARQLFALGADVNQHHPVTYLTPLHLAAELDRVAMVQLFVERGASINAKTTPQTESTFPSAHDCWRIGRPPLCPHNGETPLHLAMRRQNWQVAKLLLDAGADPNAEDAIGDRPLDYVPQWAVFPDTPLFWKLLNHRSIATANELKQVIDWIIKTDAD